MKKKILAILCLSLGVASSAQAFSMYRGAVATASVAALFAPVVGAVCGAAGMAAVKYTQCVDNDTLVLAKTGLEIYDDKMSYQDCLVHGAKYGAALGATIGWGGAAAVVGTYYSGKTLGNIWQYFYGA